MILRNAWSYTYTPPIHFHFGMLNLAHGELCQQASIVLIM
jgi:hypothetical protein